MTEEITVRMPAHVIRAAQAAALLDNEALDQFITKAVLEAANACFASAAIEIDENEQRAA